jgi:hypothetical protein
MDIEVAVTTGAARFAGGGSVTIVVEVTKETSISWADGGGI